MSIEQQVNLYQPIAGAGKQLFSARTIVAALALLAGSLAVLAGYGSLHGARMERAIGAIENRQRADLAAAERSGALLTPTQSVAELDEEAKRLTLKIAARQRALDLMRLGAASPATGFAARLEALAHRQLDGLWLHQIVVSSGAGGLALRGAALSPQLVPAYLAALAGEPALAGERFDRLTLKRAPPEEAPAQLAFELAAPGLVLADEEHHP